MTSAILEKTRGIASRPARIGLADLAKTQTWRPRLAQEDIIEVTDRKSQTSCYLVSAEAMDALAKALCALDAPEPVNSDADADRFIDAIMGDDLEAW